ncbi:MAG: hypothetical protein ACOYN0_12525 [Phycisphaerales bacterium]
MKRVALLVALASLGAAHPSLAQQQQERPRWRGPIGLLPSGSSNTKTIKVGRQSVKVSASLVRRPFNSDLVAIAAFDSSAALSGAVTLAPAKRGQTVPSLSVVSATFTRKAGRQNELWDPAIDPVSSADGRMAIPFTTTTGVEVGGATLVATSDQAFAVSGGPGTWDAKSKVSCVVMLTDGTKSFRVTLPKIPVKDLIPPPPPPPPPVREVDVDKELMIRDLSVVESELANGNNGAWTFGRRFRNLFTDDAAAQAALKKWLATWETDQVVNEQTLAARAAIRDTVIEPWKARSGQAGIPDEVWDIDWDAAPFRLLAIVNRTDLAAVDPTGGYGGDVTSAGEGRFVFGVTDANAEPLPFTVIFEYAQPASNFFEVSSWANQWHALGGLAFGSDYNAALKSVTDQLTVLKQIRTGEGALTGIWQFREFTINGDELLPTDSKATPANVFNGTDLLASFINTGPDVGFDVPLRYQDVPFRAGGSDLPPGFVWDAPGAEPVLRSAMALISCNGCHHRETGTDSVGSVTGLGAGFVHIAPRRAGEVAQLSGFLRGDGAGNALVVNDPISGVPREFNELAQRKQILGNLAGSGFLFMPGVIDVATDTAAADIRAGALRAAQYSRRGRVH